MKDPVYSHKLERMEGGTLLPRLAPATRAFVRRAAAAHRLTFQELRAVAEAARDLEMWREKPFESWWRRAEEEIPGQGRERKKALMGRLREHLDALARGEKAYPDEPLAGAERRPVRLVERESPRQVFGLCAAYSEKTVCCGLRTIDAVRGCAFGCSYCTIQTFYGERAELEAELSTRLSDLDLDPAANPRVTRRWVSKASTTSLTTPCPIWQELANRLFSAWTFFCSESMTWPQFWHMESNASLKA